MPATRRRAKPTVKYVEDTQWHISRNIPVALIITLVFQAAALIWWGSGVTKDVQGLKTALTEMKVKAEKRDEKLDKFDVLATELRHIREILARVERVVDRAGIAEHNTREASTRSRRRSRRN